MSRVTEIESRFAEHNIPLALALGFISVTSRIRRLVADGSPSRVQGPPSEFDLVVLGLLSVEERLSVMGRDVDTPAPGEFASVEVTSWLR